jgi:hypothetical protein
LYDSQAAATTALSERLASLEGVVEASRKELDLKIATILDTMEHGFRGLAAIMRTNDNGMLFISVLSRYSCAHV